MKPAPYGGYLFRQTPTPSVGVLRKVQRHPRKGHPCSYIAILPAGAMCQCSLSGVRLDHSLTRSALLAVSLSVDAQYWEPVERSLPRVRRRVVLGRRGGGLSCSGSNLAHK